MTMPLLKDRKRLQRLATWLPLAVWLLVGMPTLWLWPHPPLPPHDAGPEQMRRFSQQSEQSDHVMLFVLGAIMVAGIIGSGVLSSMAAKLPQEEATRPGERVLIAIDAKWQRLVHSPVVFVVALLSGVACTFCPLFLYQSGKGMWRGQEWFVVPVCFIVIYGVSMFYMSLGAAVIAELRKLPNPSVDPTKVR